MEKFFSIPKLFILSLALLACSCSGDKQGSELSKNPATKVSVFKVLSAPHLLIQEVPGDVRAKERARIEPKVTGRIEKLDVFEGMSVKAGELLAKIDSKEILAKLDQATAENEQAKKDFARYEILQKQNAITQRDYDSVKTKVLTSQAEVDQARANLDNAQIRAPFNGVIARKLANAGDLAMPGKAVLEMESPELFRFEASVPESLINNLKLGASYEVKISSLDKVYRCTLSELSPVADEASRSFLVKLDLPQGDGIRTGQFGHLAVPLSSQAQIWIPKDAMLVRGQMEIVYVVKGEAAKMRLVRSGKTTDGEYQILSGLEAGEVIVRGGLEGIKDGEKVIM